MRRRTFIKVGMTGLAWITAGSVIRCGGPRSFHRRHLPEGELRAWPHKMDDPPAGALLGFDMSMEEVEFEMVDRIPVYHWAFNDSVNGLRIPGSVIVALEGDRIEINVTNNLPGGVHSFAIPGVVQSPIIAKGQTVRVAFAAPRAGTYIYLDPENAPMNRVMGLNGVLVVLPDPQRSNTPYSDNTPAVQQLFDMLGTTEIFPGDPWALEKREWLWVFHGLDSSKNELVRRNPELTAEEFLDGALTDYHLISGKSGFFAAHDPNIFPHGNIGQPALIRSVGTGLVTQSPHIHGNHVYQVAVDGVVQDNPFSLDTWTVRPMSRVDVLLPFETPPDAHPWPPSNIREFPMPFTMHCHIEMSQTAAGGNYPQGSVTDWEITSPQVGGPEAPEEEFPFFRGMDPDLFRA